MDKNVYAAIQSRYSTLSGVGEADLDYILTDPVHITSISIQQMASRSLTSRNQYSILQSLKRTTGFE